MASAGARLGTTLPARKPVVRAARTESKGVSLGFRYPHFELPESLPGKVWKLKYFESHLDIPLVGDFSNIYSSSQDGSQFMAVEAKLLNYFFPYLCDECHTPASAINSETQSVRCSITWPPVQIGNRQSLVLTSWRQINGECIISFSRKPLEKREYKKIPDFPRCGQIPLFQVSMPLM